jgi:hypothetical protein
VDIISMAQQASPKVNAQREDFRAIANSWSVVVVTTPGTFPDKA